MRPYSTVARAWWDYTTLDIELLKEAARITAEDLPGMSREGFTIHTYATRDEFFLAEALEYVRTFSSSTADHPRGICGPIGPTEQLPLVARIINDLEIPVRDAHFWGMDEWVVNSREVNPDHPLSFRKADMDLCFNRIDPALRMPDSHLHFPTVDGLQEYSRSFDTIECMVMQGGQGETKHWAFNDPPKRNGAYMDAPPSPEEYRRQGARLTDLHPMTLIQNARTSGGGTVYNVPTEALTVGPQETWKSKKISIWHPGWHDNPFGIRLTTLMLHHGIADASVPMSLLSDHDDVVFHILLPGFGTCEAEMH